MRAADVQGAVGFLVEGLQFKQRHPGALEGILETGAVGPATLKAMLLSQTAERLHRIGVVVRNIESDRIVRIVERVLDVVDLVTETLEADDVMDVLPDDSGDGHSPHEAQDDDLFSFHDSFFTPV